MPENQEVILRYSYRLRVGTKAQRRLESEWNCARWVWNKCVESANDAYADFKDGKVKQGSLTFCGMCKRLTKWRSEYQWLLSGSAVAQQQTVRRWSQAYQAAFKNKGGFPDFRKKNISYPCLEFTAPAFRINEGCICLPGCIKIPVVWSRSMPSVPRSCTITMSASGDWSVGFVVRRGVEPLPPSGDAIGIDWGVKNVATCSDHRFDLRREDQLKDVTMALKLSQRKLSRAKKWSHGRKVAKKRVAKIYAKVARQKKDRAFKWAKRVVTNFGKIAVEDFKPAFLAKSRMAKKATDGAVGMTKQILVKAAEAAGRDVILVNPAYTTQTCSQCGSRNKTRLTLNNRTFVCESCGHTADRDRNAAWTILARAGFNPTNVDDVRPSHDFGCVGAV